MSMAVIVSVIGTKLCAGQDRNVHNEIGDTYLFWGHLCLIH